MKKRKVFILSALVLLSGITFGSLTGLTSCQSNNPSDDKPDDGDKPVDPVVESVVITKKVSKIAIGSPDVQLGAAITPMEADQGITWATSNPDVATVSETGLLKVISIGKATITATSTKDNTKKDSFELTVTGTIVKGKVTSFDGTEVAGAKVTIGDKEALTEANGNYSITLDGSEKSHVLIVSKEGYVSREIDITSEIIDGQVNKDIVILSSTEKVNVNLTGKVENVNEGSVNEATITVGETTAKTNKDGVFTFNSVPVTALFDVTAGKEGYVNSTKSFNLADYLDILESENRTIEVGTFDLFNETETYLTYTSDDGKGDKHTYVNIYRGLEGLTFKFTADFDITQGGFFYELFLDFGDSTPFDMERKDANDMDFQIDHTGIKKAQHYGGAFGEGEYKFNFDEESKDIEVYLPYTYIKHTKTEIFGFNIISHAPGVGDRSMFNPAGYIVEWYNTNSYPRVGLNGEIYQGVGNNLKLESEITNITESLGHIGNDPKYAFNLKLGRSDNGIYLVMDKDDTNDRIIHNGTNYHIFIDATSNEQEFNRDTDNKVKHFSLADGKWLTQYDVENANSVFNNKCESNDLLARGVKLEIAKGKSIIYVPYTLLGEGVNKDTTIGLAANVEQGAFNWTKWQAPYAGNHHEEPHVESMKSFVRIDKNGEVLENTWGVRKYFVNGVIKNYNNEPIAGVEVRVGDKKIITKEDGTYNIVLGHEDINGTLVVSKAGYTSREFPLSGKLHEGQTLTTDVLLYSPTEKISISLNGKVANLETPAIKDAIVKVGDKVVTTTEDGTFNVEGVEVTSAFSIEISKEGYKTVSKTFNLESHLDQIAGGNRTINVGSVELFKEVAPYLTYAQDNGNGPLKTYVNVYRGFESIDFVFTATDSLTKYNDFNHEIFLDFGDSQVSESNKADKADMSFNVYTDKVKTLKHGGDTFGEGNYTHSYNEETNTLTFSLPYSYIKHTKEETFGLNVISHGPNVGDRSMANPGGFMIEWYNQLSYARVAKDGSLYQSNTNNLTLDKAMTITRKDPLGIVSDNLEKQIEINVAKNDEGLFIITNQIAGGAIKDYTNYNIFIDTVQDPAEFDREVDTRAKRISIESGAKWAEYAEILNRNNVNHNVVNGNDLFTKKGLKIESINGKVYIFIPYSTLGEGLNKDSVFGISANLQTEHNVWTKWQAPYPAGYKEDPHAEDPRSYIRLDKDLNIIENTWSK